MRFESMRVIFALTALNGWYMMGVDVRTAYLYDKLDEEIYMHQPEGFIATGQENKVICLQRALYGLKQASPLISIHESPRFQMPILRCQDLHVPRRH
jgi:Reverse transcriptase (RNA-dependent DNA polymerase)